MLAFESLLMRIKEIAVILGDLTKLYHVRDCFRIY